MKLNPRIKPESTNNSLPSIKITAVENKTWDGFNKVVFLLIK